MDIENFSDEYAQFMANSNKVVSIYGTNMHGLTANMTGNEALDLIEEMKKEAEKSGTEAELVSNYRYLTLMYHANNIQKKFMASKISKLMEASGHIKAGDRFSQVNIVDKFNALSVEKFSASAKETVLALKKLSFGLDGTRASILATWGASMLDDEDLTTDEILFATEGLMAPAELLYRRGMGEIFEYVKEGQAAGLSQIEINQNLQKVITKASLAKKLGVSAMDLGENILPNIIGVVLSAIDVSARISSAEKDGEWDGFEIAAVVLATSSLMVSIVTMHPALTASPLGMVFELAANYMHEKIVWAANHSSSVKEGKAESFGENASNALLSEFAEANGLNHWDTYTVFYNQPYWSGFTPNVTGGNPLYADIAYKEITKSFEGDPDKNLISVFGLQISGRSEDQHTIIGDQRDDYIFAVNASNFTINGNDGDDNIYVSFSDAINRARDGRNVSDTHRADNMPVFIGGDGIDTLHFTNMEFGNLNKLRVTMGDNGNGKYQLEHHLFGPSGSFYRQPVNWDVHNIEIQINSKFSSFEVINASQFSGDTFFNGSDGNDVYVGSSKGTDRILGGNGDDYLDGGGLKWAGSYDYSNDSIYGGAGDDIIISRNMQSDILDGGEGIDTLIASGDFDTSKFDVDRVKNFESFSGSDLADSFILAGTLDFELRAIAMRGGNDKVVAFAGDHVIYGGLGNDKIYAGAGNDILDGGDGNDTLTGEEGNDYIFGGQGNDQLSGGEGIDSYYFSLGDGKDIITDQGINKLIFDLPIQHLNYIEKISSGGTLIVYGDSNEVLVLASDDDMDGFRIEFSDGFLGGINGVIQGTEEKDLLNGTDKADIIFGKAGDDFIVGGLGSDIMLGGEGFDIISYDTSQGGYGVYIDLETGKGYSSAYDLKANHDPADPKFNDVVGDTFKNIEGVVGTERVDRLVGDELDNLLQGRGGHDALIGRGGDDTLIGGIGADRFYYQDNPWSTIGDIAFDRMSLGHDTMHMRRMEKDQLHMNSFKYDELNFVRELDDLTFRFGEEKLVTIKNFFIGDWNAFSTVFFSDVKLSYVDFTLRLRDQIEFSTDSLIFNNLLTTDEENTFKGFFEVKNDSLSSPSSYDLSVGSYKNLYSNETPKFTNREADDVPFGITIGKHEIYNYSGKNSFGVYRPTYSEITSADGSSAYGSEVFAIEGTYIREETNFQFDPLVQYTVSVSAGYPKDTPLNIFGDIDLIVGDLPLAELSYDQSSLVRGKMNTYEFTFDINTTEYWSNFDLGTLMEMRGHKLFVGISSYGEGAPLYVDDISVTASLNNHVDEKKADYLREVGEHDARLAFNLFLDGNASTERAAPVVIDLNHDGLKDLTASQSGVRLDINDDGVKDYIGWIEGNDAFLFYDRDQNGMVSGYSEIAFVNESEEARTDLEGLRVYDENGNNWLDIDDSDFDNFLLWQDFNKNGISDSNEISSLSDWNITAIGLCAASIENGKKGAHDNSVHGKTSVRYGDGRYATYGDAYDVEFRAYSGADPLPSASVGKLNLRYFKFDPQNAGSENSGSQKIIESTNQIENMQLIASGTTQTLDIAEIISQHSLDATTPFGLVMEGVMDIEIAEEYQFQLHADHGAIVYIDGNCIVSYNSNAGITFETGVVQLCDLGKVYLSAGSHDIRIEYFENFGDKAFDLRVNGPDTGNELIDLMDSGLLGDPGGHQRLSATFEKSAIEDFWVSHSGYVSDGDTHQLIVKSSSLDYYIRDTFLKFDMGNVSSVSDAIVTLTRSSDFWQDNSLMRNLQLELTSPDWTEGQAFSTTPERLSDISIAGSVSEVDGIGQKASFDVKSLLNTALNAGVDLADVSFKISTQDQTGKWLSFYSGQSAGENLRPTISYTLNHAPMLTFAEGQQILAVSVAENEPGMRIADLFVEDPDENDNHTFWVDDDRFEIRVQEDGQYYLALKDSISLDYEVAEHIEVLVTVSDLAGLRSSKTVQITVEDRSEISMTYTKSGQIHSSGETVDHFVFLAEGARYTIDQFGVDSSAAPHLNDPYFRGIFGPDGSFLGYSDDDGGLDRDSRTSFVAPETGEYRLEAGAYGSHTGVYNLTVNFQNYEFKDKIENPIERVDHFVFLEAGTRYRINQFGIEGDDAALQDPYFRGIYNSEGHYLGYENDDFGSGRNSQTYFIAPETAEYRLETGSYGNFTGNYMLSVYTDEIL